MYTQLHRMHASQPWINKCSHTCDMDITPVVQENVPSTCLSEQGRVKCVLVFSQCKMYINTCSMKAFLHIIDVIYVILTDIYVFNPRVFFYLFFFLIKVR